MTERPFQVIVSPQVDSSKLNLKPNIIIYNMHACIQLYKSCTAWHTWLYVLKHRHILLPSTYLIAVYSSWRSLYYTKVLSLPLPLWQVVINKYLKQVYLMPLLLLFMMWRHIFRSIEYNDEIHDVYTTTSILLFETLNSTDTRYQCAVIDNWHILK